MDETAALRFGSFLAVLAVCAAAEALWPRRPRRWPRRRRWPTNLLMPALGALLVAPLALIGPLTALAAAVWAARHGLGLFHLLDLPRLLEAAAAVILLDLAIYWQHRIFHRLPALWRLHRVHHADPELDTTTGVRFHPGEYLLSMLWKAAVVLALGAGAGAVLTFELLLNALALFNHANLRLPARVDRLLRRVIVTPDFHAVHHGRAPDEHHRNFGFNLVWWDHIFGSYRARPRAEVAMMDIGLAAVEPDRAVSPGPALLLPARRPPPGE